VIRFISILACLPLALLAAPLPPDPSTVAILYNSSSGDSKALAEIYAKARRIPADRLVGLKLPESEEISRKTFNEELRDPLIREYDRRKWWTRGRDPQGNLYPQRSGIRILVCMRGVPSRIAREPGGPALKEGEPPFKHSDEAAVDAELALLGVEGLPLAGPVVNPYFKSEKPFAEAGIPMTLVGRIDAATRETCERMIRDAIETEKTGLWGMSVIDVAQKFSNMPEGDPALENIAKSHLELGIPVIADRFPDTLPTHYPLRDTAIYYGWYDVNVSGPFLNPSFRFKKGAVAVHLHSFSAGQLRNPDQNWSAPLLERGAAATLGNVYEPYLQMTHHFDLFQARLLAGHPLVEAAYMALPVLSWQNLVLGDPLYRPFLHLGGSGEKADADRDYRALRLAHLRWKDDPKQIGSQLREAADRLKSGTLVEALGLMSRERADHATATAEFRKAKLYYTEKTDRLRMDLHVAAIERAGDRKEESLKILRGARTLYGSLPESAAAVAWINLMDPPPPPPAAPAAPNE
jgi:uncharacterized protein (TIGR03790 family)